MEGGGRAVEYIQCAAAAVCKFRHKRAVVALIGEAGVKPLRITEALEELPQFGVAIRADEAKFAAFRQTDGVPGGQRMLLGNQQFDLHGAERFDLKVRLIRAQCSEEKIRISIAQ